MLVRISIVLIAIVTASSALAQSLPYSGTTTSSSPAWAIGNYGTGPAGLFTATNSADAFEVYQWGTGTGATIVTASGLGAYINSASGPGMLIDSSTNAGADALKVNANCTTGPACVAGNFYASGSLGSGVLGLGFSSGVRGNGSLAGVHGETGYPSGHGVKAIQNATGTVTGYALYASSGYGIAGRFESQSGGPATASAVSAQSYNGAPSISATNTSTGRAISATSTTASAVFAQSSGQNGIWSVSTNSGASGVYAENYSGGYGLAGRASGAGTAVFGDLQSPTTGYAGYFIGRVHVSGTLSKSAGTFRIDHPQDPANRYLVHSFVESPEMKNVYDGTVLLDANGEATVALPSYFEALNRDFRYQLTSIGAPSAVFIKREVANNSFEIGGGRPGQKISWQVTGVRQDPYALANPIIVEEPKRGADKGRYLNPEVFGRSNSFRETSGPSPATQQ